MSEKVLESNDYKNFELCIFNRDVKKIRNLEESMRKHGYIGAYPLHVVQNGSGKFKIKAGHHRFYVAQKLGIPVKFVVCKDTATIHELERSTNTWSMRDYLDSYCRLGKEDYLRIKEYCDETGISLGSATSMLGGHSAGSGNFQYKFKDGTFKIDKASKHAGIVRDIILHCKNCGIKFFRHDLFVQTVSKIVWVPELEIGRLKAKIKLFHSFMDKRANLDQYLDMIEEIYNRQAQQKIPLKFLANEAAKKRSAVNIAATIDSQSNEDKTTT